MEHTLGAAAAAAVEPEMVVLILVLVEHTLGAREDIVAELMLRLNPCFSGTYSRRATFTTYTISKYYACKFGIFICF